MEITPFSILDLNFLSLPGAIAVYLIQLPGTVVLIETGPASAIPQLTSQLAAYGIKPTDITDVFLTHIHLDHAGAVGWFAQNGATIHVHPNGAPHLINPEKLLNSARRIYGEQMDSLWGNFLPVPPSQIHRTQHEEIIRFKGAEFQIFETPGHANHHNCILYNGILFSGDIGGIRIAQSKHIELPTPPPEFDPHQWHTSIDLMKSIHPAMLAPTHFGAYSDVTYHLDKLNDLLSDLEEWLSIVMQSQPQLSDFSSLLLEWLNKKGRSQFAPAIQPYFEVLNPSWMSAAGLYRYWNKTHQI
ncbi:MAG: MBL fold metallo-hydrolase [Anaerolineales bacterium]